MEPLTAASLARCEVDGVSVSIDATAADVLPKATTKSCSWSPRTRLPTRPRPNQRPLQLKWLLQLLRLRLLPRLHRLACRWRPTACLDASMG